MGSIPGLPEMPVEDIKTIAKTTMTTFAPIYAKSFAIGLVNQLKKEADTVAANAAADDSDSWQLLDPPIAGEPLCKGWMTKLGAVKKNWKRRWFVAYNAADNFVIQYFEKEEHSTDDKKKKGCIQPCGYTVKRLTKEEERKEFGDFAITLKPYGRRRQWFLKCDNEADLKQWLGVLKYSARHAQPPLNKDQVLRFAFQRAYRITRWRLGVWGWYYIDRTEEEMLGQLVVDKCNEDCMGPVYEKIPGGRLESKIRHQVEKVLDSTVGAVVGAGWRTCLMSIEGSGVRQELETAAKGSLGVIFAKEAELKEQLKAALDPLVATPLSKLAAPIVKPVCDALLPPIVAAYTELCVAYNLQQRKVNSNASDMGKFVAAMKAFVRDIRYPWGVMRRPLFQVYRAFRDGYDDKEVDTATLSVTVTINLGDVLDLLPDVTSWQVEQRFEDSLRSLMSKAVVTFLADAEHSAPGDGFAEALTGVSAKLVHDARKQLLEDVQETFMEALRPAFRRNVTPLIKSVLAPVENLIPDALKSFLDIDKMANEVLDGVLASTVAQTVTAATAGTVLAPLTTANVAALVQARVA